MLSLTRRTGEEICIGADVTVRVKEIRGDRVIIGVDAPTSIAVHRREVVERIKAQWAAGANAEKGESGKAENAGGEA